jgi:CubicO group peptidase (beta-lactamase class C family)
MELAEQGKVDLDTDINTYLDFRIPDTFPRPITLKHLMTHTSGFGERWLESLVSDESELMSEREWLVSNMPARIFAPGEAVGYSNYNAMLAGYIVSRISASPTPNTFRSIFWTRWACLTQPRHRLHRRTS